MNYLEEELKELIKKDSKAFSFLEKGSLDGVWYWDLENPNEEWMSDRLWEVLGYEPKSMDHKASEWMSLIHPDDLEFAKKELDRAIVENDIYNCPVVRYLRPDGEYTYVRCRGLIIRDEEGKPIRVLGAHNDLTEHYKSIELLKLERDKLRKLNRSLEDFAFIAAHDLKEPMRSISFLSQLIKEEDGLVSDSHKEYMDMIISNAKRLETMLTKMFNYSKAAHTIDLYEHTEIKMSEKIRDVKVSLVNHISKKKAIINDETNSDFTVLVPHNVIYEVLLNLISNSIKYSKKNKVPIITISDELLGDFYILRVKDNGIGIRKGFDPFKLFTRGLHGRNTKGTGIGLAICKKYVDNLNGEITYTSSEEGTEFQIKLSKNLIKRNCDE